MAVGVVTGGVVMLWGRKLPCAVLYRLIADVRAGRSRVLVVRGEPGIGKTALLGYAADAAPDFQVARAEGAESEMELPFAALHQLCGRMLDRLDRLPGPQRDALEVAFGLRSGSAPDRFHVGLAVLGLLAEVAAERPLLCLVDDAQWLDRASAQALAFVARRLDAESVELLLGTRDRAGDGGLTGLPGLTVEGLSEAEARVLLASVLPGRLDDRVRDRIVAESGGNPLALLELPSGVTAADLAGGFGVAGPLPVAGRIEGIFERRLAPLPPRPAGCSPSPAGSPSATRWSAPRSTRRPRRKTGGRCIARWRRRPIRRSIRTGVRGTEPRPPPGPMRTWPPSWSARPAGRRRAAGSRRPPPSWTGRPR